MRKLLKNIYISLVKNQNFLLQGSYILCTLNNEHVFRLQTVTPSASLM